MIFTSLSFHVRGQALQSDYFLSEGINLHYVTAGVGEPLILIHGFSDNLKVCFQDTLPGVGSSFISRLSENYQIIALDVRGHGNSDKPTESTQYGKMLEEDVIRLMDHLGLEKAHILGYSMGAFITGNLVVDHPERLISATLVGGSHLTKSQYSSENDLIKLLDDTSEDLKNGKGISSLLKWFWPEAQPEPSDKDIAQINQEILTGQNIRALEICVTSLKELCLVDGEKLKQTHIPVTLINGTDDPLTQYIFPFQNLRKGSSISIEGANHMDILMFPECLEAIEKSLVLMSL